MIETTTTEQIRLGMALRDLVEAWQGDEALENWVDQALAHIPGLPAGMNVIWSTAD